MSNEASLVANLEQFFFAGVDPVRLDTFRRCFSVTFLMYMGFRFTHAAEWLTDYGFHLTPDNIHLSVPVPWPTMPLELVAPFGFILFGSIGCLIAGYQVRWMTWLVFACAVYVLHVDWAAVGTLNKMYVVGYSVLAVSPPPRTIHCRDGTTRELQSVWPIRILQATLLIQYFTAGTCKVFHGDWHWDAPYVLWAQAQGAHRTEICALLLNTLPKWIWGGFMYSSLAFELLSPLLFMNKRLVHIGIVWGSGFHMGIAVLMKRLVYFSVQIMSFYVLFLKTEELYALRAWFSRPSHTEDAPSIQIPIE